MKLISLNFNHENNKIGYGVFRVWQQKEIELIKCGEFTFNTNDDADTLLDLITEYEPSLCVMNNDSYKILNRKELIRSILFIFQIDVIETNFKKIFSKFMKKNNIFNDQKDLKAIVNFFYGIIPMSDDMARAIVIGHYISERIKENDLYLLQKNKKGGSSNESTECNKSGK